MWLATQHGFYSIVQKTATEFHVRARVRQDLENLGALLKRDDVVLPDIEEWPDADYRYRYITTRRAVQWILARLVDAIDYDNFKSRISSLPDQRAKQSDYGMIWHFGLTWQNAERERTRKENGGFDEDDIRKLIRSSADDVKCSMGHCSAKDLPLLRASLQICQDEGLKTKAAHLERRIKQLEKAAV
jgi:hypothetical protein